MRGVPPRAGEAGVGGGRGRRGRGAGYSDKSVTNIGCGRHVPSAAEHYRQYFARGLPTPDTVSPVPEVSWLVSYSYLVS